MSAVTKREQPTYPSSPAESAPSRPRGEWAIWKRLARSIPTAAIVMTLAALAAWGHHNEWNVPKFSALMNNEPEATDDWCKDHNVPESKCIECRPDLLPPGKDYGWCTEHGVAQCPLEHPEVAQLNSRPVITEEMRDQVGRALAIKPRPENNSRCTLHQRRIQFASLEAIEKTGVDVALVQERPIVEAVAANGEVVYDQTRLAHLSSRASGTIWQVEKYVGDRVQKGEVLALVDAVDVGRAKSEFLQAITQLRLDRTNYDRLAPLAKQGAVEGRRLIEVESALQEAQIRLQAAQQTLVNLGFTIQVEDFIEMDIEEASRRIRFLGLPADLASRLDPASTTSNLFPLRSPLDGVVVDRGRQIVEGEVVDSSTVLFTVADVSRLWLTLHVRQEDVKYISLGQPVLFRSTDSDEGEIRGAVGWISTAADDQTRTVQVRADLPNPDGRLHANTFGIGRIVLREEPSAVVIPSEALHWDGACHVVFVRDKNFFQNDAPKFFHVRSVRPGVKNGDVTEIIAGLLPGEVIASKNSVVLEAQLLKSNLGAGCCEVDVK